MPRSESAAVVEEVFLAVLREANGKERLFCARGPSGEKLPLVAVDKKSLRNLHSYVRQRSDATGQTIRIISFTVRGLYETVRPTTTGGDP